jgi:hypothetical protein
MVWPGTSSSDDRRRTRPARRLRLTPQVFGRGERFGPGRSYDPRFREPGARDGHRGQVSAPRPGAKAPTPRHYALPAGGQRGGSCGLPTAARRGLPSSGRPGRQGGAQTLRLSGQEPSGHPPSAKPGHRSNHARCTGAWPTRFFHRWPEQSCVRRGPVAGQRGRMPGPGRSRQPCRHAGAARRPLPLDLR